MRTITIILSAFLIFGCASERKPKTEPPVVESSEKPNDHFYLEKDFQKFMDIFRADTLEINDLSTEGGEMIVYHTSEREYWVINVILYGELGRVNATYWADKDLNPKLARINDFEYDRPIYESGLKESETVFYGCYYTSDTLYFNRDKLELDSLSEYQFRLMNSIIPEALKKIKLIK